MRKALRQKFSVNGNDIRLINLLDEKAKNLGYKERALLKHHIKSAILESIESLSEELQIQAKKRRGRPPKNYSETDIDKRALIINIFDVHFGKVFEKNGTIIFDIEKARTLVDSLFDNAILTIKFLGEQAFDEVVVVFGGDLLEGDGSIFSFQKAMIEESIVSQIMASVDCFLRNIIKLQRLFPHCKIRIYGVPGNHGQSRTQEKLFHPIKDNYDTQVYILLEKMIEFAKQNYNDIKNVDIQYATEKPDIVFNVKGWNFGAIHEMKRNLYTPTSKVSILGLALSDKVDVILTGHFHDTMVVTAGKARVIRNGSFLAQDQFARSLLIPEGYSEQTIIVVHKSNPVELIKFVQL